MGLRVPHREIVQVLAVAADVHDNIVTLPPRLAGVIDGLARDLEIQALLGVKVSTSRRGMEKNEVYSAARSLVESRKYHC